MEWRDSLRGCAPARQAAWSLGATGSEEDGGKGRNHVRRLVVRCARPFARACQYPARPLLQQLARSVLGRSERLYMLFALASAQPSSSSPCGALLSCAHATCPWELGMETQDSHSAQRGRITRLIAYCGLGEPRAWGASTIHATIHTTHDRPHEKKNLLLFRLTNRPRPPRRGAHIELARAQTGH